MALAVEKAAVVVVCMSSKYKESPNCRTGAILLSDSSTLEPRWQFIARDMYTSMIILLLIYCRIVLCFTEGEYAFKQRKSIVPLRLEVKYLPDGWLGALVGNSLFFDFSTQEKVDSNFNNFVRELGERGKLTGKHMTRKDILSRLSLSEILVLY